MRLFYFIYLFIYLRLFVCAYLFDAFGWWLAGWLAGCVVGVDYAMLALVKDGHLRAITEKVVNGNMNAWVRGPGLTIVGYSMCVRVRVCVFFCVLPETTSVGGGGSECRSAGQGRGEIRAFNEHVRGVGECVGK